MKKGDIKSPFFVFTKQYFIIAHLRNGERLSIIQKSKRATEWQRTC